VRRRRALALGLGAALAALAAAPGPAAAHGLVGRADLPIPEWLFGWGAAVVLVVSFVALAVLWREPVLEPERRRPLLTLPGFLEPLCGALGVAVFVAVVYAGLAGTQTATANLAPTAIYVLLWVGVPVLSVLIGDVFRAFNPWRAIARAVARVSARRAGTGGLPEALPYPDRLGHWPAAAMLLAFTWVELAYTNGDDPSTLALLALVYAAVQLAGMSVYGIEPWTSRADGFSVLFNLFSRISAVGHDGRAVHLRRPLAGLASFTPRAGTVALLCVMIGSTAFDGASEGPLWTSIAPDLQRWLMDAGAGPSFALEVAYTLGLLACVAIVLGIYAAAVAGMGTVEPGAERLAARFAHSLVPIAFAYVLAHYFSLLVYQGQATAYLASDPLGQGSDLLGTAGSQIDYGVISATGIWYVQVGALVTGHVAGLMAAHDRALALFRSPRAAARSQYWMLVVMIGFTSLGLWLLSASNS
jgi:hypothetical protein